ncbi:MAG TPA: hypothetical protein VNO21_07525 [Polyangiaceae bacterium]|nr:hypothetical protein [Polyangiaceae bacterium]
MQTGEEHISQPITDQIIKSVADEADVHERSVERRLLGLRVKGRVAKRVDAVLERRGLRVAGL